METPVTDSTSDAGATARFRSGTSSPEELLRRVRELLAERGNAAVARPNTASIDLLSGSGLIDGWFAPEKMGEDVVRWAARRFSFEGAVGAATHLLVEACLFPESGFQSLRARLKVDTRLGGSARLRTGWNRAFLLLPPEADGFCRFFVDAGGSWCPARSGLSADTREISVAVRRLELVDATKMSEWSFPPFPGERFSFPSPPPDRWYLRAARKIRSWALGRDLSLRISGMDELAAELRDTRQRLREDELRLETAARALEDRLLLLTRACAEIQQDAAALPGGSGDGE